MAKINKYRDIVFELYYKGNSIRTDVTRDYPINWDNIEFTYKRDELYKGVISSLSNQIIFHGKLKKFLDSSYYDKIADKSNEHITLKVVKESKTIFEGVSEYSTIKISTDTTEVLFIDENEQKNKLEGVYNEDLRITSYRDDTIELNNGALYTYYTLNGSGDIKHDNYQALNKTKLFEGITLVSRNVNNATLLNSMFDGVSYWTNQISQLDYRFKPYFKTNVPQLRTPTGENIEYTFLSADIEFKDIRGDLYVLRGGVETFYQRLFVFDKGKSKYHQSGGVNVLNPVYYTDESEEGQIPFATLDFSPTSLFKTLLLPSRLPADAYLKISIGEIIVHSLTYRVTIKTGNTNETFIEKVDAGANPIYEYGIVSETELRAYVYIDADLYFIKHKTMLNKIREIYGVGIQNNLPINDHYISSVNYLSGFTDELYINLKNYIEDVVKLYNGCLRIENGNLVIDSLNAIFLDDPIYASYCTDLEIIPNKPFLAGSVKIGKNSNSNYDDLNKEITKESLYSINKMFNNEDPLDLSTINSVDANKLINEIIYNKLLLLRVVNETEASASLNDVKFQRRDDILYYDGGRNVEIEGFEDDFSRRGFAGQDINIRNSEYTSGKIIERHNNIFSPTSKGLDLITTSNNIDFKLDGKDILHYPIDEGNKLFGINKYIAKVPASTELMEIINNNRNGYITLSYRGKEYKGFIEEVTIPLFDNKEITLTLIQKA